MRLLTFIWVLTLTWQVSTPCRASLHSSDREGNFLQSSCCSASEEIHSCCSSEAKKGEASCPSGTDNHGPCTSGCGCVCCTVVLMPEFSAAKITPYPEEPTRQLFLSEGLHSFDFHSDVWEPPKL